MTESGVFVYFLRTCQDLNLRPDDREAITLPLCYPTSKHAMSKSQIRVYLLFLLQPPTWVISETYRIRNLSVNSRWPSRKNEMSRNRWTRQCRPPLICRDKIQSSARVDMSTTWPPLPYRQTRQTWTDLWQDDRTDGRTAVPLFSGLCTRLNKNRILCRVNRRWLGGDCRFAS